MYIPTYIIQIYYTRYIIIMSPGDFNASIPFGLPLLESKRLLRGGYVFNNNNNNNNIVLCIIL